MNLYNLGSVNARKHVIIISLGLTFVIYKNLKLYFLYEWYAKETIILTLIIYFESDKCEQALSFNSFPVVHGVLKGEERS